jgi:hypothetical protein
MVVQPVYMLVNSGNVKRERGSSKRFFVGLEINVVGSAM